MRHINCGQAEFLADPPDFRAHLEAELGIEVRERFVEQQAAQPDDKGSGESDPLLLAAGKLGDFAVGVRRHLDGLERVRNPGLDLSRSDPAFLEAERDIFCDRHVRPQGVTLEHHSRVALVRRQPGHVLLVE